MNNKKSLFDRKYLKVHILSGLAFLMYAGFLQITKIYSPLWYLTGWRMPTTGVTRAWLQFIQGNIIQAFEYNCMFLLAPILALAVYRYLFFKEKKDLTIAIVCSLLFLVGNIFQVM